MVRSGRPTNSGGLRVNTQVNTNVAAMTDVELDDYRKLLQELKALLPDRGSGLWR
jgi:hypothetical protein